ncbi:hypothetical protein V5O48_009194 [Marasmius crinis-equi]|uniref:beta-glucosidase n=1 Tax=Marasmius crinis-equi TaxID=585013 RepID=A0ABR3FBY0_9AGAR
MSQPFFEADIPALVKKLTLDEKISLLGAPNWWNTQPIERLGIPSIRMSDGPNGVRGSSQLAPIPAQCLPCATSMASTFDPELLHEAGVLLGEETKIKSSTILLAPTCNLQRNPIGGRAFESFSEDPHLSGTLAAAYVKGVQSTGVAASMSWFLGFTITLFKIVNPAIKHFVCNDQEHERTAAESVLSDRALREVYLYPFMIAQRDAQPWAYMTSYGRLRGTHCSENQQLLQGVLRDEWKFDGIVMSDWRVEHGTYSNDQSVIAGLELEMPGPPVCRTKPLIYRALKAQKLSVVDIDDRVTSMLKFIQHQAKLNPDVVYGDGKERTRESEEAKKLCRRLAADGIVLLKNDNDVLPIKAGKYKKVAIIGPNAQQRVISGGGSAALKPSYVVTPYDGLVEALGSDFEVGFEVGCYAHKYLPTLERYLKTHDGKPGWLCSFYNNLPDGTVVKDPIAEIVLQDTRVRLNDFLPPGLTETFTIKMTGELTLDKSMDFEFGLAVAGKAKLYVDGKLTIDNWTHQRPGDFFYGSGSMEEKATLKVESGKSLDVLVEYTNVKEARDNVANQPSLMMGMVSLISSDLPLSTRLTVLFLRMLQCLGGCEKIDPEKAIQAAEKLAAESDVVVYVGGLNAEWESEGFDRPDMELPGLQQEVIKRIAKANKHTVVVVQAVRPPLFATFDILTFFRLQGAATAMPYAYDPSHPGIASILQAWYLGNESGNAIADILTGKVNPSGKLSLTLPKVMEDIAAYPNLKSERGKIAYREDLFVGYKHFQGRNVEPAFYFGHGLSYTTFKFSDLAISKTSGGSFSIKVSLSVKNTGTVPGSEVVQVYISYPERGITHPKLQLRGYIKVKDLQAGESRNVEVALDKYALAYWHSFPHSETEIGKGVWKVDEGDYGVHVGSGCDRIKLVDTVQIGAEGSFVWNGL